MPKKTAETEPTPPRGTARERVVADVDVLCTGRDLEGVRELSDLAAILVASGHVSRPVGEIVVQRIRADLGFPGIGGYHQLRALAVQAQTAAEIAERPQPAVLRFPARGVAAEYRRRLLSQRNAFVSGGGYFPSRGRDIRAARRRGVYLDQDQRGELFDALTLTPTVRAVPPLPNTINGARAWIRDVGLDQFDALFSGQRRTGEGGGPRQGNGGRGGAAPAGGGQPGYDGGGPANQWTTPGAPAAGRRRDARHGGFGGQAVPSGVRTAALPEMYTALILEAGVLYDRLLLAYHHGGSATDELRLQFNAEEELSQISADTIQLRQAVSVVPRAERPGTTGFSAATGLGPSFDEAWGEIVDRVGVFRELVELAENQAKTVMEDRRRAAPRVDRVPGYPPTPPRGGQPPVGPGQSPASRRRIDTAASELMSSAGQRQVSIDSMRRLRNTLRRPQGPIVPGGPNGPGGAEETGEPGAGGPDGS
ncbi:hypothetical protein [Dietzia sp.]|uniref:hypothetical protein n=1 Tax=Dietzia sp. TaxID=1871616 RepID=UPI002FDB0202